LYIVYIILYIERSTLLISWREKEVKSQRTCAGMTWYSFEVAIWIPFLEIRATLLRYT